MTAPPILLRSPAELLAVIPHLLGFEPDRAIVVIALKDNRLGLTQRIDLPRPERADEVASTLARHALRDEAEAVLLVGYEQTPGECLPVIEAASERLRSSGVTVRDRTPSTTGAGDPWTATGRPAAHRKEALCRPHLRSRPPSPSSSGLAARPCRTARLWPGSSSPGPAAVEVATLLERAKSARTMLKREQAQRGLAAAWARILTNDTDPIRVGDAAVVPQGRPPPPRSWRRGG